MKLFYRSLGKGKPLLILHGLWGASDNWLPVAHLLENEFRVILPDMRNHGQSPHCKTMDYNALCHDILQMIEELELPRPLYAAGHSMGGKTLMHLLLHELGLFEKACVIDIAPKRYKDAGRIHSWLLRQAERLPLGNMQSRKELNRYLQENFHEEEIRQFYLKNIRRTSTGFCWKVNLPALRHNLPEIMKWEEQVAAEPSHTPVLFIKGEQSDYLQECDFHAARERYFPAAHYVVIPHARHSIHADQPQALALLLADFFSEGYHSQTNGFSK